MMKFLSKIGLFPQAVAGLLIGTILGLACPEAKIIGMLGILFIGALKAIAPVLVFILVTSSVATAKSGLGKKFSLVLFLYILSTVTAAGVAICSSYLFPVSIPVNGAESAVGEVVSSTAEVLNNMAALLVSNPVKALADGNYLGILFWSVLLGLGMRSFGAPKVISAVKEFTQATNNVIQWIVKCAPLGIIGILFTSISENGLGIFKTYGSLIAVLAGSMLFVAFILNPLIVAIVLRRNPYGLVFKCLKESGFTAFITRSSAANIPMNLKLCHNMGVQKEFYSVSIPLGSTINMNGAAITITVMTLAMCHSLGIEVEMASAFVLCLVSVIAACGSSGVAGGSLLLIPMACSLFGISNELAMQAVAVGFVIGIVQDSIETALNSSSDALFTIATEMFWREREKAESK